MDYETIYSKDFFTGKSSFLWKFGYGRFTKFYFDSMYRPIKKYLDDDGTVLDVGCAYGLMLKRFPLSYEKSGTDISEYAIGRAQEIIPEAILKVGGVEESLPFKPGSFDIVLCNDVLEHIMRPELALKNIRKVLKINGLIYITTPNLNEIRKKHYSFLDKKEHHISLFSHKKLRRLLQSLGFKIKEEWNFFNFFVSIRSKSGVESGFICRFDP